MALETARAEWTRWWHATTRAIERHDMRRWQRESLNPPAAVRQGEAMQAKTAA